MKILLLNKYWRHAGGVEVHAFEVESWLRQRGHTVIPFAMREDETAPNDYLDHFPKSVELRGTSLKQSIEGTDRAVRSADSRRALRELIETEKPDAAYVLHIYHQLGMSLLNELHTAGIPTVLSLHDYKIVCPNYRLFSERTGQICTKCLDQSMGFAYNPVVEKCWSGSATAGAALSLEAVATRLRRSYRLPGAVTILNSLQRRSAIRAGVDPDRLIRVPHPVKLGTVRPAPSSTARFLYLGRLVPEKGVDILIRAVAAADQKLTIAGDGRSRQDLEELAAELGANVEFAGTIERDRVADLMRSSRALIVPSIWHEVSPLVVFEAIANDVPVIASSVGGMVDQLEDNRGFLVPPGDAEALANTLSAVASDERGAQSRSARARRYAGDEWTEEKWSQNLVRAFELAGASV
ncbi:glycosyltransferase [Gordonia amicalis]|uniref:glycosyltransferase n=1 Tax=Gordonia amicalis TaxID=89053 RepID=UPI001EDD76E4|nr:glycosyltransferase [Gordonia amicalis]UKO93381.1 glycosyltransferase [Gordonia amicalis]